MTVRVYQFDDVSAPQLTGEAGKLIDILRACLVTGYGSQVAAGWTEEFTGTNQVVFKNGTGSSGSYFRLLDDGTMAAGAREAQMWMYDTMSAISTGTNVSPSANTNNFFRKSATLDTTIRFWRVIASEKAVHVLLASGEIDNYWQWHSFGDYALFNPTYGSPAFLIARPGNSALTLNSALWNLAYQQIPGAVPSCKYNNHILLNDGIGYDKRFSVNPGFTLGAHYGGQTYDVGRYLGLVEWFGYNAPQDAYIGNILGELRNKAAILEKIHVFTYGGSASNATFLGVLPGIYESVTRLTDGGNTINLTGPYAGRSFYRVKFAGGINSLGFFIETTPTATW